MSTQRAQMNEVQKLDLEKQYKNLLEEARTVMPGIQALFGFQLIAVFQQSFSQRLNGTEQLWHLAAIGMSALAAGLTMFPAALQRQSCPDEVTSNMTKMATVSLASGLLPLILAVSIDFWLLSEMILKVDNLAKGLGWGLFVVLMVLWYVIPHGARRFVAGASDGRSRKAVEAR